jgi:hypothetical protein
VLAPLAPDWNQLDPQRKQKWRGIAQRYPRMSAEEQQRVLEQMRPWAELTPDQRRAVREQYKSMRTMPPDKKEEVKQKWQEYQSLPPETKRELASRPPPPPPPSGPPRSTSVPPGQRCLELPRSVPGPRPRRRPPAHRTIARRPPARRRPLRRPPRHRSAPPRRRRTAPANRRVAMPAVPASERGLTTRGSPDAPAPRPDCSAGSPRLPTSRCCSAPC